MQFEFALWLSILLTWFQMGENVTTQITGNAQKFLIALQGKAFFERQGRRGRPCIQLAMFN